MEKFSLDAASSIYKAQREALRQAEISLTIQREKVAAMRRELTTETPVPEDYVFTEATASGESEVRLSGLFERGSGTLIVFHYMWKPDDQNPCPMCTMWTDGYNAVAPHVSRNAAMVVVAKQDAATVRAFADQRGWDKLRTVSSGGTSFNLDFGMEDADGNQMPGVSVFVKNANGQIHHFYTLSAIMGDDHYRGMDLLSPVWNMLDLLPNGRSDWMPSVKYS